MAENTKQLCRKPLSFAKLYRWKYLIFLVAVATLFISCNYCCIRPLFVSAHDYRLWLPNGYSCSSAYAGNSMICNEIYGLGVRIESRVTKLAILDDIVVGERYYGEDTSYFILDSVNHTLEQVADADSLKMTIRSKYENSFDISDLMTPSDLYKTFTIKYGYDQRQVPDRIELACGKDIFDIFYYEGFNKWQHIIWHTGGKGETSQISVFPDVVSMGTSGNIIYGKCDKCEIEELGKSIPGYFILDADNNVCLTGLSHEKWLSTLNDAYNIQDIRLLDPVELENKLITGIKKLNGTD